MEKEQLIEIANTIMPFGKYQGRALIDLPEEYLLWFARKGEFPKGNLGELMALTLLIKTEGLEKLVKPLKRT
ncbi:cytoplasmic protein [Enterobacteriaceae bacterium 4M9]|nr:cytoplasmic protein [Enterobacteriaceae bacterium 4M9]